MNLSLTVCLRLFVGFVMLHTILLLAGCGYHLIGASPEAPQQFSVAIPVFRNLTYASAGEGIFTEAIVQALQRQGVKTLGVDTADYVVNGEIVAFTAAGNAFSATDIAMLYQVEVEIDITIRKRLDNSIMLRERLRRRVDSPAQTQRSLQVPVDDAAKQELARQIAQDLLVRIITLHKNEHQP